ncbi:MAG: hypothetical protein U5L72_06560 [Bacteroidales bacterium]|nr:hypothetical protein [Bacteroidales bacterium]
MTRKLLQHIPTDYFAKNVKALVEKEYWGLYNMVCGGQTSRFEVATELIRLLKLEGQIKLTPVGSDFFKETYFAQRPSVRGLVNRKLI